MGTLRKPYKLPAGTLGFPESQEEKSILAPSITEPQSITPNAPPDWRGKTRLEASTTERLISPSSLRSAASSSSNDWNPRRIISRPRAVTSQRCCLKRPRRARRSFNSRCRTSRDSCATRSCSWANESSLSAASSSHLIRRFLSTKRCTERKTSVVKQTNENGNKTSTGIHWHAGTIARTTTAHAGGALLWIILGYLAWPTMRPT